METMDGEKKAVIVDPHSGQRDWGDKRGKRAPPGPGTPARNAMHSGNSLLFDLIVAGSRPK